MRIEAYIIMYNEAEILPLVIKHYKKFCTSITFYDNFSTDNSQQIAESLGCKVKKFGIEGQLDDLEYLKIKNNCWKGSDADWVIVCDCDEILWHHEMKRVLSKSSFIDYGSPTIWKPIGWQIQSNSMPENEITDITNGWEFENYSKSVIFNPKEIKEINYRPGAHACDPVGNIVYDSNKLFLLHYKNIGGVDRLIRRNIEYAKRLSKTNRQKGYGIHYLEPQHQTRREWIERLDKSTPLW